MLILQKNCVMDDQNYTKVYKSLKTQMENGLVLLDGQYKLIYYDGKADDIIRLECPENKSRG